MNTAEKDEEISAFFDRCAEQKLMYEFDSEEQDKLRLFLASWNVRPGQRVLEPGCGSGRLTQVLAEATAPDGEVYAGDLSPAMIHLAQERHMPSHVHLVCGPATSIERPDEWFDTVVCLNVFPHVMDKSGALREFARVLKASGNLWISHFSGRDELNRFHHHAASEVSNHMLPCPHTMRHMMQDAGFGIVELTDRTGVYSLHAVKQG